MASFFKKSAKLSIKVPKPRTKPADMGLFPHVTPPRKKPLQTRVYTKAIAQQDPSQFTNIGFGDTGLTGES